MWLFMVQGSVTALCALQVDGMQLINALQKEEYQDVPIIGEHKGSTGHSAHK